MKRVFMFIVFSILLISATMVTGCEKKSETKEPTKESTKAGSNKVLKEDTQISDSLNIPGWDNVGKTFNQLMQEYPNLVIKEDIGGINAAAQVLGTPDSKSLYYFYSAQSYPLLKDLSENYGDKIKSSGIVSTVGDVFSNTKDGMPIEEFFSAIGVKDYNYILDLRWIHFNYKDMAVDLRAVDKDENNNQANTIKNIKHSNTVIIYNTKVENANNAIVDEEVRSSQQKK